jgi:hypothetical protein
VLSALVGGLLVHGGIAAVGVGVAAAGQAVFVASLTEARDEKIAADAAEDAAAAERIAAAAALADEQSWRESILLELEQTVRDDARQLAAEGYLEGPILDAVCFPGGDESSVALTDLPDGALECMAVTETTAEEYIGYTYTATISWADGEYTWELV